MAKPLPDGKDENAPADLITKFQRIREQDPEKLDRYDIIASALANISAGSDTTSISLNPVIFHLCHDPRVLEKLRDWSWDVLSLREELLSLGVSSLLE